MGEIADMMLSGELCECCGGYIDDQAAGIPRYCSKSCARERGAVMETSAPQPTAAKIPCPQCGRHVKTTGLVDHMRVVHGSAPDLISGHAELVKALKAIATDRQMKAPTMAKMAREALAAAGVRL